MSALVFMVNHDNIKILTDSLAVNPDGSFSHCTTKTLCLPHLSSAISGLGVAGLADQLFLYANSQALEDIHDLTAFAESCLPTLFQKITDGFVIPNHITSTIYLFGIDPASGKAHAYTHRSTNGFQSENMAPEHYIVGAKPTEGLTKEDLAISTEDEAILVLLKSKAAQDCLPENDRLYIGGLVTLTHLAQKITTTINMLDLDSNPALSILDQLKTQKQNSQEPYV